VRKLEYIMFESFISKTIEWVKSEPLIDAVILIGSYARGTQREDSDVDLVILSSDKQYYIDNTSIFSYFGDIDKFNIEFYGECTSIRVWYKSRLEVEFGLVTSKWIDIPLDNGTQRALSDGYRILVDKNQLFLPIISIIPEHT